MKTTKLDYRPARDYSIGTALIKGIATAAWCTWDNATRPKARNLSDIPWSAEAITSEWLTAFLSPSWPGVVVESFDLGSGSAGSTVRRQLQLYYNVAGQELLSSGEGERAQLPASVFMKMTPALSNRLAYGISGSMAAEAYFFNELRPELEIEAPWGYQAAYDVRSCRSALVMEDLVATRGAEFCTPLTKIDRANAEDMVSTLAALHGRFHLAPGLDRGWDPLKTFPDWYRGTTEIFSLDCYHERAMEEASDVIPPEVSARRDETWPAFRRVLELHERLPRTFIHSDVHLGNWYRTNTGRMGLCDWGCCVIGNGIRDFAYAVSAGLAVEDRRAWDRELLDLYLDRLAAAGGEKPSFDEAWRRYRQHLFCALLMWTPTLCHSPLLPDMQPESVSREMIHRISTAIGDHEALDSFD